MFFLKLWNIEILVSIVIALFWSACYGAERYRYLGCYENIEKTKLLNQYRQTVESLTPNQCVDICHERRYAFAGAQKNECFCGNNKPPEFIARSDVDCEYKCNGDNSVNCGSEHKISTYETGITLPPETNIPGRVYLGCYLDDVPEFRILNGPAESLNDNTPDRCHKICYRHGFRYFGLTYIKECWCGDSVPSKDVVLGEDECNTRCGGDQNEFCGGGWRMSIYATGIPNIPENGRYMGCYKNADGNDIKALISIALPKANSNRRCLNICDQKGFRYSATFEGDKCFCINDLLPATFRDPDDYTCDVDKCPGDTTETCGSKDRTKIFRTRNADTHLSTDSSNLGCYKNKVGFPIMEESKERFEDNLSVFSCIDLCKKRGYVFSGMEYGKDCYCSHKFPPDYIKVTEEECNSPCSGNPNQFCGGPLRISVHDSGVPHPQAPVSSWYEGCFKDDDKNNRMLKGSWQELANNSPDICQKHCVKTGFQYFGLSWIKECFCGDETPQEDMLLNESECQKQCGGDSNKKCGGGWRLSVYRSGVLDIGTELNFKGCYQNQNGNLFNEHKILMSGVLTPKRCQNYCYLLGFPFAGVRDGSECRCGSKQPQANPVDSTNCESPCSASSAEYCGNKSYMRLYATSESSTVSIPPVVESTTIEQPVPSTSGCLPSVTTKNGETTCKGELIFEETFDRINTSVWTYSIKMASEPDNEFVIYTNFKEVIFLKNNRLYIKPKPVASSFVRTNLTLKNCTGNPDTIECTRKSFGARILPPIVSALITTKNSFSFRYGKIEVRAKLPVGEWITPEISLISKDESYGTHYKSGKIRLALTRGNNALICGGGTKLGSQVLEVGVYFGPENELRQRIFRKEIAYDGDKESESKDKTKKVHKSYCRHWGSEFHNYSVTWTANDIIFEIDGEVIAPVLGTEYSTIRDSVSLSETAEKIYREGTRLAPFDKEFSIALGVPVGGTDLFPDNCVSHGFKKPWSNTSPKAMLNFWESRQYWNSTWIQERTALQVQHVKVYAI